MAFKSKRINQTGFTLLEVIVTITVLSIGILAVAKMQTVAVNGNRMANQMMEDTISGQDVIERIIAANFSDGSLSDRNGDDTLDDRDAAADYSLDSSNGNYYNPDVDGDGTNDWNIDTNNEIFSVSWNVRENQPDTNTKTIRFIIVANTPDGEKVQEFDFIKGQLTRP